MNLIKVESRYGSMPYYVEYFTKEGFIQFMDEVFQIGKFKVTNFGE